jgi:hypothetical protein
MGNFSLLRSGYGALQCLDWLRAGCVSGSHAGSRHQGQQGDAGLMRDCRAPAR